MKRALVATLLGLAASVASTYGQANYIFDTYSAASSILANPGQGRVQWTGLAPAGEANQFVTDADGVKADLLWAFGSTSGDLGLAVATSTHGSYGSGFIVGPSVSVPGWTSGAITFTIDVFQGASYAVASQAGSGLGFGHLTWTEPGPTAPATPAIFFVAEPLSSIPISAVIVPEPTTMALLGLGAAGLLIIRKRQ